ncbi:uncharacterized protein LOC132746819 [Ruditapes philippinarum]|uniref:uncharacterized protein LOC132746819 n=1 Tax=Ruditapes philippinarum TaxID=129788 RepID=UPI00295A9E8C|nr:uncharacterized protein LOC132746819 [Ruditapes philippinarum]
MCVASVQLVLFQLTFRMAPHCKETFYRSLEDNLAVIENYPVGGAEQYLRLLGAFNKRPKELRTFPVFVTAFDDSHLNESQGLFKSIHEVFLNSKYRKRLMVIVYDLGIRPSNLLKLKKNCKCEVRRFQYEKFPPHVKRIHTYAFKPIIVQEILMEFGFLWWMDTSVRLTTTDIKFVLSRAARYGTLFTVSGNTKAVGTLTKHTSKATFDYLQEDSCKFKSFHEIWATSLMFHINNVTRSVVKACATCALNEECIAPPGSRIICNMELEIDGRCHRFDQSVFGIIIRRLFHDNDLPHHDRNLPQHIYSIRRKNFEHYFN